MLHCHQIFTLFLLLLTATAVSEQIEQDSLIYLGTGSTMVYQPSVNGAPAMPYMQKVNTFRSGKEGESAQIGVFATPLRRAMQSNPAAVAELNKFTNRRITGIVVTSLGAGAVALGALSTEDTGESVYDPRDGQTNKRNNLPVLAKSVSSVAESHWSPASSWP